ncbi:hypothetical protein AB5N19_03099 [Seiridium cardinale]|uniref:Ketoreductase domain-containing protein n=1 Tax=Seiridium cardinale TaxID=138064 RepID=A0ABR2X8D9_9PEZI
MSVMPTYTDTWHNDVYPQIDAKRPELSMKGKRIVITGGAGGIGAATARAFAVAGAGEVYLLGRTLETLESTKSSLQDQFPKTELIVLKTDVTDAVSTSNSFDAIAEAGPIDVYINNAGYLADLGPVASADVLDWWKAFDVNVRGSVYALQKVLKNISQSGVIINVTSAVAHIPHAPGQSAYAASKLGASKMFEYIQFEHPNLRVFNLQPGVIQATGVASKAAAQGGYSWPQQDTLELPANFMVWLSSPFASFLRGRFVWANWDVTELEAKRQALDENPALLTLGLNGWPQ